MFDLSTVNHVPVLPKIVGWKEAVRLLLWTKMEEESQVVPSHASHSIPDSRGEYIRVRGRSLNNWVTCTPYRQRKDVRLGAWRWKNWDTRQFTWKNIPNKKLVIVEYIFYLWGMRSIVLERKKGSIVLENLQNLWVKWQRCVLAAEKCPPRGRNPEQNGFPWSFSSSLVKSQWFLSLARLRPADVYILEDVRKAFWSHFALLSYVSLPSYSGGQYEIFLCK